MRFSNFASVLALAASAQALIIPVGTTDGTYTVTVDAAGVETHTKIAEAGAESDVLDAGDFINTSSNAIRRRNNGQIWCGCGFNMNPGNCDAAVADLKNQLGPVISPGRSFYSIRGDVVAFACNRGSSGWVINDGSYASFLQQITNSCGLYIAGSRQGGENAKALISGYMRYSNGVDFCGASTGSPANHC